MARRKKTATRTKIIKLPAPRASNTSITVRAPTAPARRRRGGGRRRGGARSTLGGLGRGISGKLPVIASAWIIGQLEKSGTLEKIPRVFGFGPVGSAALLAFLGQHFGFLKGSLADNATTALLTLAAYRHGHTGTIGGADYYPGGAVVFDR